MRDSGRGQSQEGGDLVGWKSPGREGLAGPTSRPALGAPEVAGVESWRRGAVGEDVLVVAAVGAQTAQGREGLGGVEPGGALLQKAVAGPEGAVDE